MKDSHFLMATAVNVPFNILVNVMIWKEQWVDFWKGFLLYYIRHLRLRSKNVCLREIRRIIKRIPNHEIESHMYITGKTGSGKSSLIEQRVYYQRKMMAEKKDKTIIFLDPH